MEKTTLYCTHSKFGKDSIMFINRKILDNGIAIMGKKVYNKIMEIIQMQ